MTLAEVWSQAEALRRRLSAAAARAAAPLGLNGPGLDLLRRASQAAPKPLSASRLGGWNPTVNPWAYEAGLQHLAALGLLAPAAAGAYALTPAGQSALAQSLALASDRLGEWERRVGPNAARLAEALERLVAACLAAPQPPHQTRLRLSQRLALAPEANALVRVEQALSGLADYYADCHLAAWQPHMVSGPAWDTLAAVGRGAAGTVDAVYGQLAGRGWPRDTYVRALQELVRWHWCAGPEPFTLTPLGRDTWERAVAQTHRAFFAPWQVIAANEREGLSVMLQSVCDTLPPV